MGNNSTHAIYNDQGKGSLSYMNSMHMVQDDKLLQFHLIFLSTSNDFNQWTKLCPISRSFDVSVASVYFKLIISILLQQSQTLWAQSVKQAHLVPYMIPFKYWFAETQVSFSFWIISTVTDCGDFALMDCIWKWPVMILVKRGDSHCTWLLQISCTAVISVKAGQQILPNSNIACAAYHLKGEEWCK